MRGALGRGITAGFDWGIIPADAGSTWAWYPTHSPHEDHTRGCGEHPVQISSRNSFVGSSPRMRGAQRGAHRPWVKTGIIPADTGSTSTVTRGQFKGKDHPRGCGEHDTDDELRVTLEGSSPRMRGAPGCGRLGHDRRGIIPADAGSTFISCLAWPPSEDHPRGCGEHQTVRHRVDLSLGSSPRMRGARAISFSTRSILRIIPADAGSTADEIRADCVVRDHPRGCGEHSSSI